jgi:hypothetical protein
VAAHGLAVPRRQVGARLQAGLREAPSCIAFARENDTIYHPDRFVALYHSFLLERTPTVSESNIRRKDEYPD